MCGRWSMMAAPYKLKERFDAELPKEPLKPRYNIAPTQEVPIILNSEPGKFKIARWGLIPFWAKDEKIGYKTINARAETLLEKPAYARPFKNQRCLVPADGFYEWKTTAEGKTPYRITMKDDGLFAFACIFDTWGHAEKKLTTFSIITVNPNKLAARIHNRMPAILLPEDESRWLNENSPEELISMLKPYPAELMKAYEISPLVNSPKNDVPKVIEPIQASKS